MHLDVGTLSLATVFVMALLGSLLAIAGVQNRTERALVVWAGAYVGAAVAIGLIMARGSVPGWLSIELANALALVSIGLFAVGLRVFDRQPPRLAPMFALAVLWLAACMVPAFRADINLRVMLVAVLGALPAIDGARVVWRGRAEPLMSRGPTAWVLLGYAVVSFARIPVVVIAPLSNGRALLKGPWLAFLTFGSLLVTVVLAFLLLNLVKERSELRHKIAAMIDPLSGVGNRRAFFADATRLWRRQLLALGPLAVVIFDLDRFKQINDHFGHAVGDTVLRIFAATARRVLGDATAFGRIGGEEFAAVLPVENLADAISLADRVRREFALAAADYGRDAFGPSVSAGVAIAHAPGCALRDTLRAADQALYRAKAAGRNRVEAADAVTARPCAQEEFAHTSRRQWRREATSA